MAYYNKFGKISFEAKFNRKIDNFKSNVVRILLEFIVWFHPDLVAMSRQGSYDYKKDNKGKR